MSFIWQKHQKGLLKANKNRHKKRFPCRFFYHYSVTSLFILKAFKATKTRYENPPDRVNENRETLHMQGGVLSASFTAPNVLHFSSRQVNRGERGRSANRRGSLLVGLRFLIVGFLNPFITHQAGLTYLFEKR